MSELFSVLGLKKRRMIRRAPTTEPLTVADLRDGD